MKTDDLLSEQKVLDKTIGKIKQQVTHVKKQLTTKKTNFKTGNEGVGDDVALRRAKKDLQSLTNALDEPYFGRLDIIFGGMWLLHPKKLNQQFLQRKQ